jgi:hypothetical protein
MINGGAFAFASSRPRKFIKDQRLIVLESGG